MHSYVRSNKIHRTGQNRLTNEIVGPSVGAPVLQTANRLTNEIVGPSDGAPVLQTAHGAGGGGGGGGGC